MINPILNKAIKYGGSFTFNGVDEYMSTGTSYSGTWATNSPFSFKAVFKLDTIGGQHIIISNNGGGSKRLILFVDSSNNIRVDIRKTVTTDEIRVTSSTTVTSSVWYKLVITYDGGKSASGVKMFLDGVKLSTTTIVDSLTTSEAFTTAWGIGNVSTVYFDGNLSEVSLWDSELSEGKSIQYSRWKKQLNYKASNKVPVARWDFDTYASPNVNLGSGSNFDMTPTNMDASNQSTDTP
jgi:hypothetical protein